MLQSMEPQEVRHNLANEQQQQSFFLYIFFIFILFIYLFFSGFF